MNDSDCGHVFALLSQYLDRELPPTNCEQIEAHLHDCPECIQFVESLKRSVQLCRQFGTAQPAQPPDRQSLAALQRAFQNMIDKRRTDPSADFTNGCK